MSVKTRSTFLVIAYLLVHAAISLSQELKTQTIPLERWQSGKSSDDNNDKKDGPGGVSASPGAGAGKGGGGGGSIRSAGGSLGKRAAVQEDEYFHKKAMKDLEKLHDSMKGSLESAGKMAQTELEKDKKVEEKMKKLSAQLKDIIEEAKKNR